MNGQTDDICTPPLEILLRSKTNSQAHDSTPKGRVDNGSSVKVTTGAAWCKRGNLHGYRDEGKIVNYAQSE